ncbi:DUF6093 family protein [Nocardioides sp. cx-169]|nr:DUF6093 family protein [Nocardioides sp. cx-169]
MTSRVNIWRRVGLSEQDEDNGSEAVVWAAVYVDHPFRLGGSERGGSSTHTVSVGGVEMQLATRVGNLPHDTDDLMDGDLIEVISGEGAAVDSVFRIVEADWADQQTARRVPVVAADRPEEWP